MKAQGYLQVVTLMGAALLTGCGGGGGDSASASDPATIEAAAMTPLAAAVAARDSLGLSYDSSFTFLLSFSLGNIPAATSASVSSPSYHTSSISLKDLLLRARKLPALPAAPGTIAATASGQTTLDCTYAGEVVVSEAASDTSQAVTFSFKACEENPGEVQSGTIKRKETASYFLAEFSNYSLSRTASSTKLTVDGDIRFSGDEERKISSKHLVITSTDTSGATPISDTSELLDYSYVETDLVETPGAVPTGIKIVSSGRSIRKHPDFSYDISFANNPAAEGSRQTYVWLDEDDYPSAGILLIKDNKKSSQKIVVEVDGTMVNFTYTVGGETDTLSYGWNELGL